MAYGRMYWFKIGNTEMWVEDLARSHPMVLGKGGTMIYPGVCQHCTKTNIRYMAHLRQNLANTLERSEELGLDNDQYLKDSTALFDGKTTRVIEVGCVCVMKYLTDCGVDKEHARRLQEEATKIMHILQHIAAAEAACDPKNVAESLKNYAIVAGLRDRAEAVGRVSCWKEPTLQTPERQNEYWALRNVVYKDYEAAANRWKRENFGFHTYFKTAAPTPERMVAHFQVVVQHEKRKLDRYTVGAHYE